jgi:TatD DNase family protein
MLRELVDSCFNFTNESFRKDEAAVIQRAIDAGVTTMMVTGSSADESLAGIQLAERYPENLYTTVGVHPHLSKEWQTNTLERLRKLAQHSRVKAIGETGLDYNRNFSPQKDQRYAFEQQMELACELDLPLFLHERDAHEEFTALLRQYRKDLNAVVVHCFTGNEDQLETYLEMDLHIGITGWICDERRGVHLQELITRIPSNRLMIETDAPYLVPRHLRPQPKARRNEPAFLPHILETVARSLDLDPTSVAQATTATARRFYRF